MKPNEALTKYIGALVDELSAVGVEDVVISPGSRSTPISMLVNEHPSLTGRIAVDERGAGFFALGIAKSRRGGLPGAEQILKLLRPRIMRNLQSPGKKGHGKLEQ